MLPGKPANRECQHSLGNVSIPQDTRECPPKRTIAHFPCPVRECQHSRRYCQHSLGNVSIPWTARESQKLDQRKTAKWLNLAPLSETCRQCDHSRSASPSFSHKINENLPLLNSVGRSVRHSPIDMADFTRRTKFNEKLEKRLLSKKPNTCLFSNSEYNDLIDRLDSISANRCKDRSDYRKKNRFQVRLYGTAKKLVKLGTDLRKLCSSKCHSSTSCANKWLRQAWQ